MLFLRPDYLGISWYLLYMYILINIVCMHIYTHLLLQLFNVYLTISIITLNINVLNASIKRDYCMLSHIQLFATPGSSVPWDSPGKNPGVGSHYILGESFQPQSPALQVDSSLFEPRGKPKRDYWSGSENKTQLCAVRNPL